MRNFSLLFLLASVFFFSCNGKKEQLVVISTDYGDMTVKLYDETPLHRDNFVKLAKKGNYDGLLIHQVNPGFTIESGAPDSKNAPQSRQIGTDKGVTHTIRPEIIYPQFFNKKGAVGAILMGDEDDEGKESSGSLFYIVTGTVYTTEQLETIEKTENEKRLNRIIGSLFAQNKDSLSIYMDTDKEKFEQYQEKLIKLARMEYDKTPETRFTDEQRTIYTSIGGAPQLDNNYTVFGEIVEGFDVLDKINNTSLGFNGRPVEDIKIKVKVQ